MERRRHWEFFFFFQKTPCSHFHGCVEYCCVVLPWTKGEENFQMDLHSIMSRPDYTLLWQKNLQELCSPSKNFLKNTGNRKMPSKLANYYFSNKTLCAWARVIDRIPVTYISLMQSNPEERCIASD